MQLWKAFWSALLIFCAWPASAYGACESVFLNTPETRQIYTRYFNQLKAKKWENIYAFSRFNPTGIYMTRAFDRIDAEKKRSLLALLLLDYGEYTQLAPLLPRIKKMEGSMFPYSVYGADGRILSVPYNPCNRLITLTEYERSRLQFLGIKSVRRNIYPLSTQRVEAVKKIFWNSVGYEKSGDYWIAWVPERGYFEINVPSLNHEKVLADFWKKAPSRYKYAVLDRGTHIYTYFRGKRTSIGSR